MDRSEIKTYDGNQQNHTVFLLNMSVKGNRGLLLDD